MSTLALFVETPRAGNHGHRFLVSCEDQVPEKRIAEYVKAVDKDVSFGANYLGVARSVEQRGTAVREGREIVVLVGIDISRANVHLQKELTGLLRKYLEQLEQLLQTIDWSHVGRERIVIYRRELSGWLDEVQRRYPLRPVQWIKGPRPLRNSTKARTWRRIAVVVIIIAIMIISGLIIFPNAVSPPDERPVAEDASRSDQSLGPVRERRPEETIDIDRTVNDLGKEWNCPPEDVVRSLLRAANWDRRREADKLSLATGLADAEVRDLLKRLVSKNGIERLLVSPAISDGESLASFVRSYKRQPITESCQLREWLFDAWEKWEQLRKSEERARKTLDSVNEDPLTKMLIAVARLQPDVGFGDHFSMPTTPLFDRQDVMIWRFLGRCQAQLEYSGINKEFSEEPVASPLNSELASFLAALRANRLQILGNLASSRLKLTEAVMNANKENRKGAADAIKSVYRAFEDFIEHLGRFEPELFTSG